MKKLSFYFLVAISLAKCLAGKPIESDFSLICVLIKKSKHVKSWHGSSPRAPIGQDSFEKKKKKRKVVAVGTGKVSNLADQSFEEQTFCSK